MKDNPDYSDIRRYLEEEFGIGLPAGRMLTRGKKVFLYTGRDTGLMGREGIYIGTVDKGFRPSHYAAQLATKGLVEVGEKQARRWMCGLDIEKQAEGYYAVVRYGKYNLGIGKPKEGRIINNLPKNRRLPLSSMDRGLTF